VIYGSVCSGIEAATVAWHPLGWRAAFLSEIEAFPRAVLAHHYPDVPLHGDFTTIQAGDYAAIDVLVGGTPCQSFSVAGLRGGMADDRGNLALEYLRLADRLRPRWLVWENVPGVLSSAGGRDFGSFLGGLGELGYGWAYRVLDAQYFGLAQRRKRVFVVGCAGDWRRAAAVLFERHSLSGHPAPRREAGKGAARSVAQSVALRGREGGGTAELGDDIGLTLRASSGGGDKPHVLIAPALARCDTTGEGQCQDYETTTMIAHTLRAQAQLSHQEDSETYVTHTLRGTGFDASEDGTGRGTPLVPIAVRDIAQTVTSNYGKQVDSSDTSLGPNVVMQPIAFHPTQDPISSDEVCHSLGANANATAAVAFTVKDYGGDATEDLSPTLRSGSHAGSHANGGVMPAVAFAQKQRDEVREMQIAGALAAEPGMKQQTYVAQAVDCYNGVIDGETTHTLRAGNGNELGGVPATMSAMQVRRLTPVECLRLQGFPDDYLDIIYRGKPAADGSKYKAIGNSMAVPCMAWIGQRIAAVEKLTEPT
jgi:DNA (cytosine-5)-methyltransferase 1